MDMTVPKPTLQAQNLGGIDKGDKGENSFDRGEQLCEFVLNFCFAYLLLSRLSKLMNLISVLPSSPLQTEVDLRKYGTRES